MVKYTPLNHEGESLGDVFTMPQSDYNRVKYAIVFETFKGCIMTDELYPDQDDAPRTLTTKSGCLEACYSHIDTEAQKELLLFIFLEHHERWLDKYKVHTRLGDKLKDFEKELQDNDDDEAEFKLMMLKMLSGRSKKESKGVKRIIDTVKKSKYNFDNFINIYESNNDGQNTDDIDSLIKKALDKDGEDSSDDII
jgi:hypothetical protein